LNDQLLTDLEEEYNLGKPIAGNFFEMGYDGEESNERLCYLSKCLGSPFPSLIPGINDMPECQPAPPAEPQSVWESEGVVPDKLPEIPPTNMKLKFDSGFKLSVPGTEARTGEVSLIYSFFLMYWQSGYLYLDLSLTDAESSYFHI
jgi:hypothetical protein